MSKSTGKLKSLTLEEKLKLIELVEEGRSVKSVSEDNSVNKNTLHYILKHRDKIRERLCLNPNVSGSKRIKDAKSPELEQRILSFMNDSRERNQKLSGSIIKSVALEYAADLDIENFAASNGWLFGFFKRNRISIGEFNKGVDPYQPKEFETNNQTINEQVSEIVMEEIVSTDLPEEDEGVENKYLTSEVEFDVKTEEDMEEDFETTSTEEQDVLVEQIQESSWRSWCRLCGCLESSNNVELNNDPVLMGIFNISSGNIIRTCEECNILISEISKTINKAKHVDAMMTALDEREKVDYLTEEDLSDIRKDFGFDTFGYDIWQLEEDEEEPKEDTILEEEQVTEQEDNTELEETIYVDMEELDMAKEEQIEMDEIPISPEKSLKQATLNRSQVEDSFIYKCHVCSEVFERMFFLTNHTRTSHSCMPQVACSCGRYLSTWDGLMAHKRKHSSQLNRFICDLCHTSFRSKTGLTIHIKFKHGKTSKDINFCPTCDRPFKDGNSLRAHMKTHLPTAEKYTFECEICGKKMVSKWSLKSHISTMHEKTIQYFCHLCGRGFKHKSNLRSHVISHATENVCCETCGGTFKNRISLQSHKRIHKPEHTRKFGCGICDRKFHNQNHLRRHLISHSDERQFKCPYESCANEYKWQKDLTNHIIGFHTGEKPHKCIFCDRSFVDPTNLRKHKLKDHPDDLAAFETEYGKGRGAQVKLDIQYL